VSFEYDVVVIGSGPAGEKAANKAAYFGKRVAVVERERTTGGNCALGGIPANLLREAALMHSGIRRRLVEGGGAAGGLMAGLGGAVGEVCAARDRRVHLFFERLGVELIHGEATFVDAHTLLVRDGPAERRLSAAFFVVATGARASRPASVPFNDTNVFCADSVARLERLPSSLIVVGGGVIGSEYASIFAALGVEVVLIDAREQPLGFLDAEIGQHLFREFGRRGIRTYLGHAMNACRVNSPTDVRVETDKGEFLRAQAMLHSGGRVANTDGLGLDRVGVELGRRGRPVVDEWLRTSVGHIYAVGDVIGPPARAATAMEQGRLAIAHAFSDDDSLATRPDVVAGDRAVPYPLIPFALYTVPAVAMVGNREGDIRAAGTPCVVGRASYGEQDRGQVLGDVGGLLKLVCDARSQRVLGVHVVGEGAEEIVHLGQACMHFEGTLEYFVRAVFNLPTLSAAYKAAAYDALSNLASTRFQ
jgi:NAD(P) transhydrogenase